MSLCISYDHANQYIENINMGAYAGYSDWRMPTVEELASLLEKEKTFGAHIDPVFDKQQIRCWSADRAEGLQGYIDYSAAWILDFKNGKARKAQWNNDIRQGGGGRYSATPDNYVRAVRSIR